MDIGASANVASTDAESEEENQAQAYDNVVREHVQLGRPYYHIMKLIPLACAEGNTVLDLLDLGCGTGYLTSMLADSVGPNGRVLGVDPDRDRIEVAKKNAADKYTNLTFQVADGESFPEDQYDVVFCNMVMGSIEKKEPIFNRVSKNLCSGGRFVLGDYLGLFPLYLEMSLLMGPIEGKRVLKMWHHVSTEVYEDLAKSNGLEVTKKEEEDFVYDYPNIDAVIENWYAATHGHFDPELIDPKTLEAFKKKYGDQKVVQKAPFARFIFTKI